MEPKKLKKVSLRMRPNKYRFLKASEQANTSGQRRVRRAAEAEHTEETRAAELEAQYLALEGDDA